MKLEGTVEHVIYENADSGYAVFEVDAGGTDVVVAGNVGGVDNGMSVTVYGHMVNHPSYGEQFRAETIEARLPEDRTAILSYLSSGVLPYIGPSTAKKIVAKFGDDTLTVIAETPQRLCELKGITEQKAAIISNEFRRMYGVREVVAWFARYGMTAQQAVICYRALGPHTVEALTQNPYLLCGEPLQLKFGQVDTIAAALQFETGCRLRVAAGLLYALRHNAGNGHTCLPRDKLLESTSKFLRLPLGDLEAALDELLSRRVRPEVLLCANNHLALHCLQYIRRRGLKIPQDVALLTFDNYPFSMLMDPTVTAVEVDMYDMGVNAARFVLQRIRKPNLRTQSYVTSPCILEREST